MNFGASFGSNTCTLASICINGISDLRHASAEIAARTKSFVPTRFTRLSYAKLPQGPIFQIARRRLFISYLATNRPLLALHQYSEPAHCAQRQHIVMRSFPSRFVYITPRSSAYHSPVHGMVRTRYREGIWERTQSLKSQDRRSSGNRLAKPVKPTIQPSQ